MNLKNLSRLFQLINPLLTSTGLIILLSIIFLGLGIVSVESNEQRRYQINKKPKGLEGIGPLLAQLNSEHKAKLGEDTRTIADEKVDEINKLGDHFEERAQQLELVDALKNTSSFRPWRRRLSRKRYCVIRVSTE